MECQRIRELLSAYVDEELERGEKEFIQTHLQSCEGCLKEYQLIGQIKSLLKETAPGEKAPQDLKDRILREIKIKEEKAVKWKEFWLSPIPALATIGLFVVMGISLYYFIWYSPSNRLLADLVQEHKRYELAQGFMEVVTSDSEILSRWFREDKGFPLTVPVLDRSRFTILGGRFFSSFGTKGAHVLYKESSDHKISFFVFQGKRPKFSFRKIQKEGMNFYAEEYKDYALVFWEGEKFGYSLICKDSIHIENLMRCALMIKKKFWE